MLKGVVGALDKVRLPKYQALSLPPALTAGGLLLELELERPDDLYQMLVLMILLDQKIIPVAQGAVMILNDTSLVRQLFLLALDHGTLSSHLGEDLLLERTGLGEEEKIIFKRCHDVGDDSEQAVQNHTWDFLHNSPFGAVYC